MQPLNLVYRVGKCIIKAHPVKVTHHITTSCNFECEFCNRWKLPPESASFKEALKIAKYWYRKGTLFWAINGGEPSKMPWLGKLVDKISVMGMKVTVITDGSSLLDKAEELDRASMVAVSIPGPENIYRHFRPEGNFERIIEGVKARSARGSVALLVPLGTDSCTCIEEIVNIAEYCRASLIFQPLESASEGCFSEMKSYIATRKQMEKAVQEITGYKRSGVKILNSDRYLQVMTDNWPYKFNRSECCSGKLFLSLGPKGDIYRCGNHFEYGRNDFSCCGCRRYGSLEMNLLRDDITLRNNISSLKNLIGRFSDLYKWWNYWGDDKSSKIRQHKSR